MNYPPTLSIIYLNNHLIKYVCVYIHTTILLFFNYILSTFDTIGRDIAQQAV